MANATVINPADGTENNAAPHTEVTSINVPINSAINLRVIVPTSSKRSARHVPKGIRRCLLPRFQPACAASGEPFGAELGSASQDWVEGYRIGRGSGRRDCSQRMATTTRAQRRA